jgi:general stress protein 26
MNTQNQIGFITGKIQQLQTAILHSHSNCLLKFPDSLAKTLQVDEVGCVWIAVKKPLQLVHEFDRSFHVGLNYYRKGTPFFLNIFGVARLVIDPEEINQLSHSLKKECNNEDLMLCIRILQANYYENPPRSKQSIFQRWKQTILSMFTGYNNYYHFDISDTQNYA